MFEDNFWYLLIWYVITDQGTVFATGFEFMLYLGLFWVHVHLCAALMMIDNFLKTQMDNEINAVQLVINRNLMGSNKPLPEEETFRRLIEEQHTPPQYQVESLFKLKVDRIHAFIKWTRIVMTASSLIFLYLFLPEVACIHLPLFLFLPLCNLALLTLVENDFKMKLLENKMHTPFEQPKDIDKFKMQSIETEFRIQAIMFVLRSIPLATVLYLRGLNFNLLDIMMFGKATLIQVQNMLNELC